MSLVLSSTFVAIVTVRVVLDLLFNRHRRRRLRRAHGRRIERQAERTLRRTIRAARRMERDHEDREALSLTTGGILRGHVLILAYRPRVHPCDVVAAVNSWALAGLLTPDEAAIFTRLAVANAYSSDMPKPVVIRRTL